MQKQDYVSEDARKAQASEKQRSVVLFVLLLAIYIASSVFTFIASRSHEVITILDSTVPVPSFAGVFFNISNICLIFIVVWFKKKGFILSLCLLLFQFPILYYGMIVQKIMAVLPGFFGNFVTIAAIIVIYRRNKKIENYQMIEITYLTRQQRFSQRLFEQTAKALVNAIDAKDAYSHGHSMRVAEYSEKIARELGKSAEECEKIYYAGLLHDVGKIGIDDQIINKKGKLTDEEYEAIKQHPVYGNQILLSISEYPYLSIGAHHHHERYDGRGYPDKLKGEDIPEIARIIAVADAYDAMTSTRSYRDAIPQQIVREEIVKNSGTQFDPQVAKVMQHIIDLDTEYVMKERSTVQELSGNSELSCSEYRGEISEGILLSPCMTTISMLSKPLESSGTSESYSIPTIILFDSLDGRVHMDEHTAKDLNYFEYGEIRFDGKYICAGARKIHTSIHDNGIHKEHHSRTKKKAPGGDAYRIEAVRFEDHALIRIFDSTKTMEVVVALPDSARYCYIGLTGENCFISNVHISASETPVADDYIPRIAEKVTYIDVPAGDIPNVQVDGYRRAYSQPIPITDGLRIDFHSMSLPTARLIWHCPYFVLFHSSNGKFDAQKTVEYALIRIDGETWDDEKSGAKNELEVDKTSEFISWDEWKRINKEGIDCSVTFKIEGDAIITETENHGVKLKNTTVISGGVKDVYVTLTADQCALTNIRIRKA